MATPTKTLSDFGLPSNIGNIFWAFPCIANSPIVRAKVEEIEGLTAHDKMKTIVWIASHLVVNGSKYEVEDIMGKERWMELVFIRHIAQCICVRYFNQSEVGRFFGKDHTTILNARRVFDNAKKLYPQYEKATDMIDLRLNGTLSTFVNMNIAIHKTPSLT